jgi:predicted transcriptional regulator
VKEASEIMTKHGISQMPVIENNKVVGSISVLNQTS